MRSVALLACAVSVAAASCVASGRPEPHSQGRPASEPTHPAKPVEEGPESPQNRVVTRVFLLRHVSPRDVQRVLL
ncbi:MAG: hypothetical protein HYY17_16365 [Planctomycetes bacterium]|nr:hypothetical protein [Planctomycetota bacterium]